MRALTFRERLREEEAKAAAATAADPWQVRLERVRGKVDFFTPAHIQRLVSLPSPSSSSRPAAR